VASVAVGWEHALLVAAGGALYSVGQGGRSGCLGLGATAATLHPLRVSLGGLVRTLAGTGVAGGQISASGAG
jgi:hypothetical protein